MLKNFHLSKQAAQWETEVVFVEVSATVVVVVVAVVIAKAVAVVVVIAVAGIFLVITLVGRKWKEFVHLVTCFAQGTRPRPWSW